MAQDTVRRSISSLDIDLLDPPILAGLKFDAVVPTDFATPGLAITSASAPKRIFIKNGAYDDTGTGTAIGTIIVPPSQADGFVLIGESKSGVLWRHDSLDINPAGGSAVYIIRDMQMGAAGTDNSKISCTNAGRGTVLSDLIFSINSGVRAVAFDASSFGYRVERLSVGVSAPSTLLLMDGTSAVAQECEWFGTTDLLAPAFIVQGARHLFINCRVNDVVPSNKYGLRVEGAGHCILCNKFRVSTEAHMIRTETSLDDTLISSNHFFTANDEAAPFVEGHSCVFLDGPTTSVAIKDNIAEAGTNAIFGNFVLLTRVTHDRLTVCKNIFGDSSAAFSSGGTFLRRRAASNVHTWDSWNISDNIIATATLLLFSSGGDTGT